MALRRVICAAVAAFAFAGTTAAAQPLLPGSTAPADVVRSLAGTQPANIGAASVRPVSPGNNAPRASGNAGALASAKPQSMPAGGETTLVVRASDNLVGLSTNDLVVIYPDTDAVIHAVAGNAVSTRAYPAMEMVVVHAGSFDQLVPLKDTLSTKFPAAKFDLPVTYFPSRGM